MQEDAASMKSAAQGNPPLSAVVKLPVCAQSNERPRFQTRIVSPTKDCP